MHRGAESVPTAIHPYARVYAGDDGPGVYVRRSLARVRCMRGTLLLLPLDLLLIAWAATRELTPSANYLTTQGLTSRSYERGRASWIPSSRAEPCPPRRSELSWAPVATFPSQQCRTKCAKRPAAAHPIAGWRDAHSTYRRLAEALAPGEARPVPAGSGGGAAHRADTSNGTARSQSMTSRWTALAYDALSRRSTDPRGRTWPAGEAKVPERVSLFGRRGSLYGVRGSA